MGESGSTGHSGGGSVTWVFDCTGLTMWNPRHLRSVSMLMFGRDEYVIRAAADNGVEIDLCEPCSREEAVSHLAGIARQVRE